MQFGNQSQNTTSPVVLLYHGFFDSADSWAINHANDSTALVLAKEGYDVWLAAARGTSYSRSSKADSFNWHWNDWGRAQRKKFFNYGKQ